MEGSWAYITVVLVKVTTDRFQDYIEGTDEPSGSRSVFYLHDN